ncbi:putative F-box protein GID2 [Tripterygium wilfordii]|uniref:Putative F-box protein GID2 n=1 Tax=Tripterygium wilfordii TaxID=458696 RepID=A0A7J7C531_TRIWF|nr:putative F-box protein GID2 [Tripterygium wilfordii]
MDNHFDFTLEDDKEVASPKREEQFTMSNQGVEARLHQDLVRVECVNQQWPLTALDERLWKLICTRHLPNIR